MSKSLQEQIEDIRRAAYEQFNKPAPQDIWVRDVLDDAVIMQVGEETYRVGYTTAKDGTVSFDPRDDWKRVELEYVTVTESKQHELKDGVLTIYRTGVALGPYGDLVHKQLSRPAKQ